MGEKTAMQSKAVKLIYVSSVMLSIVCVGGAQNSISPRATKGLEPALTGPPALKICKCVQDIWGGSRDAHATLGILDFAEALVKEVHLPP